MYKNTLKGITKKTGWDLHLTELSVQGGKLDTSKHPLSPSEEFEHSGNRVMTMKEALKLKKLSSNSGRV